MQSLGSLRLCIFSNWQRRMLSPLMKTENFLAVISKILSCVVTVRKRCCPMMESPCYQVDGEGFFSTPISSLYISSFFIMFHSLKIASRILEGFQKDFFPSSFRNLGFRTTLCFNFGVCERTQQNTAKIKELLTIIDNVKHSKNRI